MAGIVLERELKRIVVIAVVGDMQVSGHRRCITLHHTRIIPQNIAGSVRVLHRTAEITGAYLVTPCRSIAGLSRSIRSGKNTGTDIRTLNIELQLEAVSSQSEVPS